MVWYLAAVSVLTFFVCVELFLFANDLVRLEFQLLPHGDCVYTILAHCSTVDYSSDVPFYGTVRT
jgi:hypothetical protein